MLDGVILGLSPEGIRVKCGAAYVKATRLDEVVKIDNPRGGSSLTIGLNQGKLIVKVNPVSWLTNQNVYGSNNAWDLCIATFEDLRSLGIMRFDCAAWDNVVEGRYDVHQLAFNTFVEAGPKKFAMMDLIKSIFGGIASNTRRESPMRWMLYPGHGMIVNNRSVNLTIYDKIEQMQLKYPGWTHEFVPDLNVLKDLLRVEVTVKYSWFSVANRKMRWWKSKNWDEEARRLIAETLDAFAFNYIMACPNVFAPGFGDNWLQKDKMILDRWRRGEVIPKTDVSRIIRRYKTNLGITLNGHRNVLWTLARPDSVTSPVTVDIAKTKSFPGTELLAPLYPMHSRFVLGAPPKLLRRVDRACGLTKARD